jgi:heme-degrading monooxygenase HmoA
LVELPERIEIHHILVDRQDLRTKRNDITTARALARIWRARTARADADEYEPYLRASGISPLEETALGFQLFRDDREAETWFTFISYWSDMEAMRAFTKSEPTTVHLLPRDDEFLIEKPDRVEICRILIDRERLR